MRKMACFGSGLWTVLLLMLPIAAPLFAQEGNPASLLRPGTMVKARLESSLSSASMSKDDRFFLKILFATHDGKRVPLPRETKLGGKLVAVKSALRDRPGLLTLQLTELIFPDGNIVPVSGEIQFATLKDITLEANGVNLTLRGRIEEADRMTIQSSTSNVPPPANNNDVAHSDTKSPGERKNESTGTLDLTRKKGHDVKIPADTEVNIKIMNPQADLKADPAPPRSP
jgi:hypothetical protein